MLYMLYIFIYVIVSVFHTRQNNLSFFRFNFNPRLLGSIPGVAPPAICRSASSMMAPVPANSPCADACRSLCSFAPR